MWRREKTAPEPAGADGSDRASSESDPGGKGRPTPSRKQAEAERRQRMLATARGEAGRTGRGAAAADRAATRAQRAEQRKRAIEGDERALSARDRGPERRYARDLVDARHTVGENFLILAVFVLILGLIAVPVLQVLSQVLLVVIVAGLAIDSVLIHRSVGRAVAEKFPNGDTKGVARYAMMRAMVSRRMRVPKPQVQRKKLLGRR